jgi:oligopeptidase B
MQIPRNSSKLLALVLIGLSLTGVGCKREPQIQPPTAKVVPKTLEKFGQARTDNYYWLRERENPEVHKYLEAENQYTAAMMAPTEKLQQKLFDEFKTRIKQTDTSVPYKKDGYFYYSRMEEGKEYPIYCRKKGALEAPEEVILDVNKIAAGHRYCAVQPPEVSLDGNLMAYAVDTVGRRLFTIYFKELRTGEQLKDEIANVTANLAWANDSRTFFYTKQHPTTLRFHRVYRHVLRTDPAEDKLVYEEKDETFDCFVFKTKSKKYLMIASTQTLSSEYRYLDANQPRGAWKVFLPRQRDHEYHVDHFKDHFYIRTNLNAKNFRLMEAPVERTDVKNWRELIPNRQQVLLEGFEIFRHHLAAIERKDGLLQLRIMPWSGKGEHYLEFGEPAYMAYPENNYDFDTPVVRYFYSSLTTPTSVYDYNMVTREKKLMKREEVLGGFDPANYMVERLHATAQDGAQVPISLVYRKGFHKDGHNPLFLYGYGSYGASMDAAFNPYIVSLLDRGFIYAIAHVRGGQELGRQWYEDGKLLKKKNTFTDFITCVEYLVREKYAGPRRFFAQGGSAGGLLIGATINMRPDLFQGVIADVPWVDVLTSMLDESIPLTTSEYDEWGNPNDKAYYDYILSYSPYDQVKAQNYPNLLVTTSFQDSQVQYWEPAKWVAKLRAKKTDRNRLMLKTEMEASHGGVSGRYKQYKETAFKYAFFLDLSGIKQ